eukprot:3588496-Pyramimonas_sp.AAC.1
MAFMWFGIHAKVHTGNGAASDSLRSGAPRPAPTATEGSSGSLAALPTLRYLDLGLGRCSFVRSLAGDLLHGFNFRQVLQ